MMMSGGNGVMIDGKKSMKKKQKQNNREQCYVKRMSKDGVSEK